MKIIESGTDVYIINSSKNSSKKTAEAINTIKPKECKNKAIAISKKEIPDNLDAIIGFTRGIPVITQNIISKMQKNGLVIDGGIGTIKKEIINKCRNRGLELLRVDIKNAFKAQSELVLSTKDFIDSKQGKKSMGKFELVSGGYIGKIGDVVVDNVSKPREIIGIADGQGGLLKNYTNFKVNQQFVLKKFKIDSNKNT